MATLDDLEETFIEEYEGGIEQLNKQHYKNATILLSKAVFALCDIMIFQSLRHLPKNHTERFRILEQISPAFMGLSMRYSLTIRMLIQNQS
jgi:hypothetical protein